LEAADPYGEEFGLERLKEACRQLLHAAVVVDPGRLPLRFRGSDAFPVSDE
jgi:hypothetical protein